MSAQVIDIQTRRSVSAPMDGETEIDGDKPIIHYYCARHRYIAFCGTRIEGIEEHPGDSNQCCTVCWDMKESGWKCPRCHPVS